MPKPAKNKIDRPGRLAPLRNATDRAEDRLRDFITRWRIPLFLLVFSILALVGRISMWQFVSADFNECLHPWMNEIREASGFHSLHLQIGNYTAPYHYLMAAMSYIPGLDNLMVIKITSTAGDFCMAIAGALVVWQLCHDKWKTALAYAALLCLPTVWLNSAAWGQCDAMYTTFILLFIAAFLANQKAFGVFCYGLALSIKLQAIFVLPALLILWLCGKLRIRQLLCGAAAYFIAFVPAMIASRSLEPLWRAYSMQAKVMALSSNIPNGASLFTGFIEEKLEMIATVLMLNCVIILGVVALYCWSKKAAFQKDSVLFLVALSACLVPYLLPAMKDRYYYVAEVLCLLIAVYKPRAFWLPLLFQLISLPSYMSYLVAAPNPFGRWLAVIAALPPIFLFLALRKGFTRKADSPPALLRQAV